MRLSLEKIEYEYNTGTGHCVQALRDVSLTIKNQERIGLIGACGSGKSTLLQIMAGLLTPKNGNVLFEGENINEKRYDKKAYHKDVGIVFQYPESQLFEETVIKDVMFGLKNYGMEQAEAEEKATEALTILGIPKTHFMKSPFHLSGGEQRRVAIAGVLVLEPQILLLDEPTAALNPKAGQALLQQLKETGKTIVLSSHNMDEIAEFSTRVIGMKKGEIVLDGTPQAVFSDKITLTQLELQPPKALKIIQMLQEAGIDIGTNIGRNRSELPVTTEEVTEVLIHLFEGKEYR